MKIDFSAPVTDRNGAPIPYIPERTLDDGSVTPPVMATLGILCAEALEAFKPEGRRTWLENVRRAKLTHRIVDGGEQDVTVEEVKDLVEHVGQHPIARVASECVRMLDPEAWERA